MIQILECILTKKNISHARERLGQKEHHPNNKQKPEITNKNTGKEHVKIASQAECESCFQASVLVFTFIIRYSGLTPLL